MDKMNKNECINYCENRIKEMWEKYGKPTDYNKRREVYAHCKDVCKNNGYIGVCFISIWNAASKKAHGE